jgi:2-dehydropantoate 2-reductase
MKLCVFGAGAIGGHLALRAARGGADVSVVARGAHLDAIKRNGLTVRTAEGEFNARVRASDDPATLGPQDAILVTVKAPALPSVARTIAPLLKADTPVAFVTNGIPWWYFYAHGGELDGRRLARVDPGDAMWNALGPERAIGSIVNAPTEVVAPGVIEVRRPNSYLVLGEPDGSLSPRVEMMAAPLRAGGLRVEVSADIRSEIWSKLLGNLSTGPMAVVSQSNYQQIVSDPTCKAAALRILAEAGAVALALGCKPDPEQEKRLDGVGKLAHKASILQDLERGRPMEIDGIFGSALELARLVNVATPTLDLLVALARMRAQRAGLYPDAPAP